MQGIVAGAPRLSEVPALSVQLLLQAETRRRRQEQAPAEGAEHEVREEKKKWKGRTCPYPDARF